MKAALLFLFVAGCAGGITLQPSEAHPLAACRISCPYGWLAQPGPQHRCRGDKRWLDDVLITGRATTRGIDGTVLTDVWITKQGDYPVNEVEMMTCEEVKRRVFAALPPDQRGVHPGEPDPLHPEHR